jgi:hypothetical protein
MGGRSSTVCSATDTAEATSAADTTTATSPTRQPCWPDDPDYLDGYTEIDLPSAKLLRARWDVDILDPEDEPPHKIIEADDRFKVRFRVALLGDLWSCIAGDWWFDLGFTPIGAGRGFDLSDLVGRERSYVRNWQGCRTRCVELVIEVPANTIPTEYCGTVYECAGKFQLYCCGRPVAVVGFEALEEYQFYKASIEG